jgi:hypothetical protein
MDSKGKHDEHSEKKGLMVHALWDIDYRGIFISVFPLGYCQEQTGRICQFAGFYFEDGIIAALFAPGVKAEKYNHKFSLIGQYSFPRRFARFAV